MTVRAASLLLLAALLPACSGQNSGQGAPPAAPPDRRTVQVGGSPWGVVPDGEGGVWVSDAAGGRVLQLSAAGEVLRELPVPGDDPRATGLAAAGGRLWVAGLGGTVTVLAPGAAGPPVQRPVAGEAADVTVDAARAWVPGHGPGGGLVPLGLPGLRPGPVVRLPETPFQVELSGPDLWVGGLDRRVFRLDAASGAVRGTTDVGPAPRGLAVAGSGVWVSVRDSGELVRLDPRSGAVTRRVPVGGQPWPVAADGDEVWTADQAGVLLRVDASTGEVADRVPVPPGARGLALTGDAVWVTGAEGTVTRVPRRGRGRG